MVRMKRRRFEHNPKTSTTGNEQPQLIPRWNRGSLYFLLTAARISLFSEMICRRKPNARERRASGSKITARKYLNDTLLRANMRPLLRDRPTHRQNH
jgi:hypothetical protein